MQKISLMKLIFIRDFWLLFAELLLYFFYFVRLLPGQIGFAEVAVVGGAGVDGAAEV